MTGCRRVLRGGAFNNKAQNARSAYRNNNHPDNRNNDIGFRPANVSPCPIAPVFLGDRRAAPVIPRPAFLRRAQPGRTEPARRTW
jgi:hypothetical protein